MPSKRAREGGRPENEDGETLCQSNDLLGRNKTEIKSREKTAMPYNYISILRKGDADLTPMGKRTATAIEQRESEATSGPGLNL